jgi:hypothetical protein
MVRPTDERNWGGKPLGTARAVHRRGWRTGRLVAECQFNTAAVRLCVGGSSSAFQIYLHDTSLTLVVDNLGLPTSKRNMHEEETRSPDAACDPHGYALSSSLQLYKFQDAESGLRL